MDELIIFGIGTICGIIALGIIVRFQSGTWIFLHKHEIEEYYRLKNKVEK